MNLSFFLSSPLLLCLYLPGSANCAHTYTYTYQPNEKRGFRAALESATVLSGSRRLWTVQLRYPLVVLWLLLPIGGRRTQRSPSSVATDNVNGACCSAPAAHIMCIYHASDDHGDGLADMVGAKYFVAG